MAASIRNLVLYSNRFSPLFARPSLSRCFQTSTTVQRPAHDAEFNQAKERLGALKNDPGNQVKLQIYALFKQSTVGACNAPKPGMMDFVGKAKWEAWNGLGAISQDDAQQKYIELVDSLVSAEGGSQAEETSASSAESTDAVDGLSVEIKGGVYILKLNKPTKKNALSREMYAGIQKSLAAADQDASVKLAVITGAGDYFCSGNDLSTFTKIDPNNIKEEAEEGGRLLHEFVDSIIQFNKPLIGLVNGPAVGIACTILGLFDAVYCTDKATFMTPFSQLGQSPEACSSYVFPKLMGLAKASEMLMFNKKINAGEALERNLVSAVIPDGSFQNEAWALVEGYSKLPPQSLQKIKTLIRDADRETLMKVNTEECELLVERWQSQECIQAIMDFFSR